MCTVYEKFLAFWATGKQVFRQNRADSKQEYRLSFLRCLFA
uniref:Uncharacterized protein n=1 Tax=Arundo donax TaxID=35708 RepID=A0A0A9GL16_ARUDO